MKGRYLSGRGGGQGGTRNMILPVLGVTLVMLVELLPDASWVIGGLFIVTGVILLLKILQ